jgi:hypothetical protein
LIVTPLAGFVGSGRGSGSGLGFSSEVWACCGLFLSGIVYLPILCKGDTMSDEPVMPSHYDVPLEEMQQLYKDLLASIDSIKSTIRSVLSAGSMIVSLSTALQIFTARTVTSDYMALYNNGIVVLAVVFVLLLTMCIVGLWPVYVVGPLAPEWDELTTAYKGLTQEQSKAKRLSSLLNAFDLTKPIVRRFYLIQIGTLILLGLVVLLVLWLGTMPRE